jgi:RND family efflux transporter MFP subunit
MKINNARFCVAGNSTRQVRMLALFFAVALSVAAVGCGSGSAKSQQPQAPQALPVKIQVVQSVAVSDTTEYVATLKSRDSAVVMPQVEGQILNIFVRSGDRVSVGTPLIQIDPAKQEATLRSQEDTRTAKLADVEYAKQQFDRINGLYNSGVVSRQDLDQSKSNLDSAQSQLRSLEAQVRQETVQLRYYKVLALTSGIVGDVPVRVGDRVTTTTLLTTIDKPGSLEVYVFVPIERSGELKMKMPVEVVDGAGKVLANSRITFISPQVDNTTQTVLVKATISNHDDRLRTAQFIRARVVWGKHTGPVVPILAVSRVGGQFFAFVAEDSGGKTVAHQKPLKVGDTLGNDYVVLDGVKPGEKLIVSGTQFLVDGMPVMPQT